MADDTLKVIFPEGEDANLHIESERSTRVVTDDDLLSTRRVTGTVEVTRRVDAAQTRQAHLPLGTLEPGDVICGDCRVLRTLYPHETQRPGVFLCQAPEGVVVVKVYATHFPPKPELWRRLLMLDHPNVIRTLRLVEDDGFFYEVQDYCEGGTLEDFVPRPGSGVPPLSAEWVMTVMLPQIAEGLRYLHEQEIIHRDIKPTNIYINHDNGQEMLVLADFDISAVLEHNHTSRDTQRAGGTWIYTAPEAFPRFIDDTASMRRGRVARSCDYYSLGITVIELLLGTTSLHQCQLPDLFDFYLQGGRVEVPQGIPGRLALLLRGLLIRNRQTRWGTEEVARWLNGKISDGDLKRIHDDELYELARANRPYRLKELAAIDLPGLADAMFRESEIAMEDLLGGDVLLNWIGQLDPGVARNIRRDREAWRTAPEAALFCAIMRCDPSRPFIFPNGAEAYTPNEWLRQAIRIVHKVPARLESLCSQNMLQLLEIWLRLKRDPDTELAEHVVQIQESPANTRLEELAYLIQPERPFPIKRGITVQSPKELVSWAYGAPEDWAKGIPEHYEAVYQRWKEGAISAWLRQRGLTSLAQQC
ncbi:MAG TPA: protein kinase, partial [Armatimonadota bacterium]